MKNKEKYSKKIVELACDGNDIAVDKRTGKVDSCLFVFRVGTVCLMIAKIVIREEENGQNQSTSKS